MLYTGIDLHRRVIALCTVNESGTVLARSRIKTDPEAILTYFHQWPEPYRAVVESTSGWYWFCDLLHTAGIDIILAHAKYLKAKCKEQPENRCLRIDHGSICLLTLTFYKVLGEVFWRSLHGSLGKQYLVPQEMQE